MTWSSPSFSSIVSSLTHTLFCACGWICIFCPFNQILQEHRFPLLEDHEFFFLHSYKVETNGKRTNYDIFIFLSSYYLFLILYSPMFPFLLVYSLICLVHIFIVPMYTTLTLLYIRTYVVLHTCIVCHVMLLHSFVPIININILMEKWLRRSRFLISMAIQ